MRRERMKFFYNLRRGIALYLLSWRAAGIDPKAEQQTPH